MRSDVNVRPAQRVGAGFIRYMQAQQHAHQQSKNLNERSGDYISILLSHTDALVDERNARD